MQSGPVAADPVSQPKNEPFCSACEKSLVGPVALHVCPACGFPQALQAGTNYFQALGVPKRFFQKASELQKRFYEISRALHPDRFGDATAEAKKNSVERMSFLNEAYRTLKDRTDLRDYILELEGVRPEAGKTQIPLELAEDWFEVQDALGDESEQAKATLKNFEEKLKKIQNTSLGLMEKTERELDLDLMLRDSHSPDIRKKLEALAKEVQHQSYLVSMSRDVQNAKAKRGIA